jgi:DNA-binding transcriptional regulator LsrR (DeoR family)
MHKSHALEAVEAASHLYHDAKRETKTQRELLIDRIKEAHRSNATQQEISERTGLSRQRVSQFLSERKEKV